MQAKHAYMVKLQSAIGSQDDLGDEPRCCAILESPLSPQGTQAKASEIGEN